MIGDIPPIVLAEGKLTETTALTLTGAIKNLVRTINGRVWFGTGDTRHRAGHVDAVYVDAVSPSVADTEFPILHRLGRVPVGYWVVRRDKNTVIYDSNTGSWDGSVMFLKSSAATASIKLLVW